MILQLILALREKHPNTDQKKLRIGYFLRNVGHFLSQMLKFAFWLANWVLAIKSKHFKNFFEIF